MRRQSLLLHTVLAATVTLAAAELASHVRSQVEELLWTSSAAASDDRSGADDALSRALGLGRRPGTSGVHDGIWRAALRALDAEPAAGDAALDGEAAAVLDDARIGTYIDEVLISGDSLVTRWPVRAGSAVRYWIQPGVTLAGWTTGHRRMVGEAFTEWNEAGLPLRFAETTDSARADIVVVWRSQFDEPISGKTRWMHDRRGWIRSARVTIALRRFTGEPLDLEAVRAIGLHEVGHALGLDHTSDPTNVMAPKVRVRALSDADRATAQLLYRLPPGSLKR